MCSHQEAELSQKWTTITPVKHQERKQLLPVCLQFQFHSEKDKLSWFHNVDCLVTCPEEMRLAAVCTAPNELAIRSTLL